MNALEAQEIRRRVEKESKRDDGLKQFNIFEKLFVIYQCGRINSHIEKKAKKGDSFLRITFDNWKTMKKYCPFIIACYEKEEYNVRLIKEPCNFFSYEYALYIYWDDTEVTIPSKSIQIYCTGEDEIDESIGSTTWYEEIARIIERLL